MELIFEISKPGRSAADVSASDVPVVNIDEIIGRPYLRDDLDLPEVRVPGVCAHERARYSNESP